MQVVIIPCGITKDTGAAGEKAIYDKCNQLRDSLIAAGVRARADLRDVYSPRIFYTFM